MDEAGDGHLGRHATGPAARADRDVQAGGDTGRSGAASTIRTAGPPNPSPGTGRSDGAFRPEASRRRGAAHRRVAALVGPMLRSAGGAAVLIALWQVAVMVLAPPPYMLPAPADVLAAATRNAGRLAAEAGITLAETVAGLAAGILLGVATGIAVGVSAWAGRLLTPVLVVSQALPVFALAPLLVLWFGFGLASKVVMAALVIYFPVASGLADGLRRTDPGLLDIASLAGADRWRTLAHLRLPAAMPALVSGIRVAAVYAPIGAVIGEWVGASRGLGLLMVQANARMQTDLLFAAVAVLALATLVLRHLAHRLTAPLVRWVEDLPST